MIALVPSRSGKRVNEDRISLIDDTFAMQSRVVERLEGGIRRSSIGCIRIPCTVMLSSVGLIVVKFD